MKADKLIEGDLSYKVIGVLYKVHNLLGPLYQEKYYQRATAEELERRKIPFTRESSVDLIFDGKKIGTYRLDFVIDQKIILETKAINRIHPKYINQILAYMNAKQIRVGLIPNFRKDRLWIKRLILPEKYLLKSVFNPLTS